MRLMLRLFGFRRPVAAMLAERLRRRHRMLAAFGVLVVLAALASAVPPFVVRHLIDVLIPAADTGGLVRAVGVLLALAVLVPLLQLGKDVVTFRLGEGLTQDLRLHLFSHTLRLPLETFLHTPTGTFVSRLYNDVSAIRSAIVETVGVFLSNVLGILALAGALIGVEWRLAVVLLPLLPLLALISRLMMSKAEAISRRDFALMSEMMSRLTGVMSFQALAHVRMFGQTDREIDGVRRTGDALVRHGQRKTAWFGAYQTVSAATGMALVAIAYLAGGVLAQRGTISLGSVIASVTVVGQLQGPVARLSGMRLRLANARMAGERCLQLLDREPVEALGSVQSLPPDLSDHPNGVEFDDVWLTYQGAEAALGDDADSGIDQQPPTEALRGVTLSVAPASTTAFVGPSGSGKTSAANLIARLYLPSAGAVRIGGVDVSLMDRASLSRMVCVVSQSVWFFESSVADNLRYAAPDASDADLWEACERAQLSELIASLPDGMNADMGQVGQRFSAGERQRFALARALLVRPRVLILDEATANVDVHLRNAILRLLDRELSGTTRIIISHDVSGLRLCDRIHVFEGGRVVENGTPSDLQAIGGRYADLLAAAAGP